MTRGDGRLVTLLHVTFVVAGMATTLLGPMMPLLMARWALSDASAGTLFTTQFAGQMLATFGSSLLTARVGSHRALSLGAGTAAVGIAAMAALPWPLAAAAPFIYGLGLGIVLPIPNFVIAALRPDRAASALNLLNVSWGVGAMVWPLVVRATTARGESGATPLLILAGGMAALAAGLTLAGGPWPDGANRGGSGAAAVSPEVRARALRMGAIVAALSFLSVGVESSVGGWIAEIARRAGAAPGTWALAAAAFWTAETTGRLLAPIALTKISEDTLFVSGLGLAGVAVGLLVTGAGGASGAMTAAILGGLGLAPIFPLLVAAMSRDVAPGAPGLMGPMFAMGGLGGATLPWLVGAVSSRRGSLGTGMLTTLGGLAVMVALHAIRVRAVRQNP